MFAAKNLLLARPSLPSGPPVAFDAKCIAAYNGNAAGSPVSLTHAATVGSCLVVDLFSWSGLPTVVFGSTPVPQVNDFSMSITYAGTAETVHYTRYILNGVPSGVPAPQITISGAASQLIAVSASYLNVGSVGATTVGSSMGYGASTPGVVLSPGQMCVNGFMSSTVATAAAYVSSATGGTNRFVANNNSYLDGLTLSDTAVNSTIFTVALTANGYDIIAYKNTILKP